VRIVLSSVYVEDQDAARRFYTEVLGFTMRENSRSASTAG
jgi:catechol 2,3-dioxygenase-like lactoylglutathione lyase family enzyme